MTGHTSVVTNDFTKPKAIEGNIGYNDSGRSDIVPNYNDTSMTDKLKNMQNDSTLKGTQTFGKGQLNLMMTEEITSI